VVWGEGVSCGHSQWPHGEDCPFCAEDRAWREREREREPVRQLAVLYHLRNHFSKDGPSFPECSEPACVRHRRLL